MSNDARLDRLRKLVFSVDSWRQQAETTPVGSGTQRRLVWWCCPDWRMHSTNGKPQKIRVSKAWRSTSTQTKVRLKNHSCSSTVFINTFVLCTTYTLRLNIQPRCTCGQGSAREDISGYVFLMELWKKSCCILEGTLLPFVKDVYPDGHKLMQDNDPKHTSLYAKEWIDEYEVNWWKTPAESPDLNPIKNLWHELKEYIQREVKRPKTS